MNTILAFHSRSEAYESAPLAQDLCDLQEHDHLSDDQIDDQLIGDLAAGPATHLASCSACMGRVAEAAAPLTSFQNVSMAWSERRSATLPLPEPSLRKPLWERHMAFATACFTFIIGIALINASHQVVLKTAELQPAQIQRTQQAVPQASVLTETASIAVAPREEQISTDNNMLKAIDDELDTSADNPAALGLEPAGDQPTQPSAATSVQD